MTPENMRIAIAESLGLTCDKDGNWSLPTGHYCPNGTPPNYPEDLNACASFEATLGYDERREYQKWLELNWMEGSTLTWTVIHATAPQRCEAYLRTKALWTEGSGG